jgi:PAS domain S-box-containing protein
MTNLKITQQDIADALSISRTTVSKVFRQKPVSAKVKETILSKACELGYIDHIGCYSTNVPFDKDFYLMRANILESMSDAFYAVDSNWTILYVNHTAEKLWGMKGDEIVGVNLWEVFPKYQQILGSQQLRKVMSDREKAMFNTYSPFLKKFVEVNAYPVETGGIEVFFRDVTNRKQTEEMLLLSDQLMRLAMEIAGVSFWRWDIANDKLCPIQSSAAIPPYWHSGPVLECISSIYPDDQEMVYSQLMEIARGERQHYENRHRRVLHGGTVVWIHSKGELILNNIDGTFYLVGINYQLSGDRDS